MSASNTTTNYNLSQFIATDIPSWLGDYNGDMLKIDAGINGAKLAADSAALAASSAQNDATSALNNVGTLATTVGTLSNTVGTAVGNINTINALIGNGTPTTTDQTIIGAINELHANQGDLTTLTTTDKSSLVGAINEIGGSVPFPDYANPTAIEATAVGSFTYTATEDCWVCVKADTIPTDGYVQIMVDNYIVGTVKLGNEFMLIPVKQGSTVTSGYNYNSVTVLVDKL